MSDLRNAYASRNQDHVFAFADTLSEAERIQLDEQASRIDLDEVERLYTSLVRSTGEGTEAIANKLDPADFIPLPDRGGDPAQWEKARETGERALRDGRVAAFCVAGGQGTRLGYDGPKGTFPVTPVLGKSLFQVFAEKILAAGRRYGTAVPWFIMTSQINHEDTVSFFEENHFFGLAPDQVRFFSQGLMPAVDDDGKILMADRDTIALSPDGHGGSLRALVRSGAVAAMEEAGIDCLSYFQVDNPLVTCVDPAFVGFHLPENSEMSSKALPKAYPEEKVGVFCRKDGQAVVIEYSDLPQRLAEERDDQGELRFRAGSIAIHLFDREFIRRIGSGEDDSVRLPFHRAQKKVAHIDASGVLHTPSEPNAWKFEMFVFDALPFARNPVIIETSREEEFSPVKNADGKDSPQSSRDDQLRQFARWARAASIGIETDETGLPPFAFEVSPLFAENEEQFVEAWNALETKPALTGGVVLS